MARERIDFNAGFILRRRIRPVNDDTLEIIIQNFLLEIYLLDCHYLISSINGNDETVAFSYRP